jgi:hypothetical protein
VVQVFIEVQALDLSLSAGERAFLGLGSIGSDPRDTALKLAIVEHTAASQTCLDVYYYTWERAVLTRAQVRDAVIAEGRSRLDAIREAEAAGAVVGRRYRIE